MTRPPIRVDCQHPRAHHQHGTYLAWKKDGCRCEPCQRAGYREEKAIGLRTLTGTHTYTDAGPARAHLQLLLTELTIGQVEARSGLHRTGLRSLLGDRLPRTKRITRKTEAALLAVPFTRVDNRDQHVLVDPTGTIRRLKALMALGWPAGQLVARLGWSHRTLWVLMRSPGPIRAHTRHDVIELYAELSSRLPAPSRQVTARRRLSQRYGWAPPAAWDDDEIDEPGATPSGHEPVALRSHVPDELAVEQIEELLELDPGIRLEAAAGRLGRPAKSLERQLYRAGRRDLIARLKRPDDGPGLHRAAS